MNEKQLERMHLGKGFIAALDQSGGSSPGALEHYGIGKNKYSNDAEMFEKIHEMRSRVIKSPSFSSERILGAILFEGTMEKTIDGIPTATFLWEKKGIVPFLKIDLGMEGLRDGVKIMKPIPGLDALLKKAKSFGIFGTKMRSFITEANPEGISRIVEQQFELAARIMKFGLVPILEPEVDIQCPKKKEAETMLFNALNTALKSLDIDAKLMFKLSIPSKAGLYSPFMKDPRVVRVVALSGGYSRDEANEKLIQNPGLIASFSRALLDGLKAQMTAEEFDHTLGRSIQSIYEASVT